MSLRNAGFLHLVLPPLYVLVIMLDWFAEFEKVVLDPGIGMPGFRKMGIESSDRGSDWSEGKGGDWRV